MKSKKKKKTNLDQSKSGLTVDAGDATQLRDVSSNKIEKSDIKTFQSGSMVEQDEKVAFRNLNDDYNNDAYTEELGGASKEHTFSNIKKEKIMNGSVTSVNKSQQSNIEI